MALELYNTLQMQEARSGLKIEISGEGRNVLPTDDNERSGRWVGTSKCGGECRIHTRPLKTNIDGGGI